MPFHKLNKLNCGVEEGLCLEGRGEEGRGIAEDGEMRQNVKRKMQANRRQNRRSQVEACWSEEVRNGLRMLRGKHRKLEGGC